MRILNFGSLNIDYVYGVDHFAAKGQTITSHSLDVFPGGKGLNQSIALARAGADVHHAGQVGRDGMFLRDLLESCAVGVTSVVVRDDVRSGNAIIQNDASGDNCIVLYPGANRAIDRDFVDQVLDGYGKDDWLLLQNEISELPYIVSRAKARGMFIVLNPSPADSRLDEVDLDAIGCFVLNEGEAAMLTGGRRRRGDTDSCDACAFLPGGYSPHPRRARFDVFAWGPRRHAVRLSRRHGRHHGGRRHLHRLSPCRPDVRRTHRPCT